MPGYKSQGKPLWIKFDSFRSTDPVYEQKATYPAMCLRCLLW